MNRTKIEWVKNPDGSQGYTWNPITGCLNHDNGLCKGGGFPCYAYKLANGRLKPLYLANFHIPRYATEPFEVLEDFEKGRKIKALNIPFYPRFWEERLYHDWGSKRGIFVCDMGELFGDWIPRKWQEDIFRLIKLHKGNRYYLLTKQPQNLIQFSPFPDNCFVGVTATNPQAFHEAEVHLANIEASVKFVSVEPMLMRFWVANIQPYIDWLIIGAQTKPYKPPEIEWVREIVKAANKAGILVFLKDNLRPLLIPEDGSKPNYLLEDIFWASEKAKLRQEMPQQNRAGTAGIPLRTGK